MYYLKYLLLLMLLIVIILTTTVKAQWTRINIPDTTYSAPFSINSMVVCNNKLFCTHRNCIYFSSDNGENWTKINNSQSQNVFNLFSNGAILFIITTDQSFWRSTDNGNTWETINNSFLIYYQTEWGNSYDQINTFASNSSAIFIGTMYSGIFCSTDNGNSWFAKNNGLPKEGNDYTQISSILIEGSHIYAGSGDGFGVFLSTDNGSSWSTISNGLPIDSSRTYIRKNYFGEITGLISNDSVIFASSANTQNIISRSTNNGLSWVAACKGLPGIFGSGSFVKRDSVIFKVLTGAIYSTKDNGNNWELVYNFYYTGNLMIYNSNFYFYGDSGIKISSDNCRTWLTLNFGLLQTLPNYPSSVNSFDSILAIRNSLGIYFSMNGGENWMNIDTLLSNPDYFVTQGTIFFKFNDLGLYYLKTPQENKWISIPTPYYPGLEPEVPPIDTRDVILYDTTLIAGATDGIYSRGYSNHIPDMSGWIGDLSGPLCYSLIMTGSIIHAGTNKGLYISTNGGNDWNQIGLNNQSVYKIVANNNNFIAFTSYGCYRSNDGGNTWNGFNIGLNNLQGLTLMGKDLYALTLDGVIWKRSFDDVMKVDETKGKLPTEFSLSQNYPNPFNPSTTINYQLPTFSFVSLKVYDILGREVATLVNEEKKAGYYSVEFNANKLSSGIYFYRMQAGRFVETKKLLLIK